MMNSRAMVIIAIVAAAALSRLLPHAPNLMPVTAVALFGGAYLSNRKLIFAVPLAALFISDAVLGFYEPGQMLAVYAATALSAAFGLTLRRERGAFRVASAAIGASVSFFVLTNFAVWAFGTLYPHSGAGLLQCYVAALPFFRNTLASDLMYTAFFFGGFALLERTIPLLRDHSAAAR